MDVKQEIEDFTNVNTEELLRNYKDVRGAETKFKKAKKGKRRKDDLPVDLKCTKCSKSFKSVGYLAMHMEKHNHPCNWCDASFKTNLSLRVL